MFPRQRTDQVYSTLQQVQRRITEQSGASAEPGGPIKAMPPNAIPNNRPPLAFSMPTSVPAPSTLPLPTAASAVAVPEDEPQPQTAPVPVSALRHTQPTPLPAATPSLYPPASGSRRYVIQVSSEMATLIVVVGLGAMVLCYMLGRYHSGAGAGAGLASGPAGSRDAASEAPSEPERQTPLYVLVLQSEVATQDAVNRYRLGAKQLNEWAQGRGANTGIRPWFGLREPQNGNVELVYGWVNGRLGMPEKDVKAHAFLVRPRHENGGGYGQAAWMVVR